MNKITEEQLERVFDAIRDNKGLEVLSKKGREAVRYYLQQFCYLEEPKDLMEQIKGEINDAGNYYELSMAGGVDNGLYMKKGQVLKLYDMFLKVVEELKGKE